jgi:hypothetical protein
MKFHNIFRFLTNQPQLPESANHPRCRSKPGSAEEMEIVDEQLEHLVGLPSLLAPKTCFEILEVGLRFDTPPNDILQLA